MKDKDININKANKIQNLNELKYFKFVKYQIL